MRVRVHSAGREVFVDVRKSATVARLKAEFAKQIGLLRTPVMIQYAGTTLSDDR